MAIKPKKTIETKAVEESEWPYGTRNYIAFAVALLVIIIGFIFLGQGSITLAPFLLVVGYCVLLPIALIIKGKPDQTEPTINNQAE